MKYINSKTIFPIRFCSKLFRLSAIIFLAFLLISPLIASSDEEKVTVPIEQVVKTSKLSAEQLAKSKVTVPISWVNEEYLQEHDYEESSSNREAPSGETITKVVEKSQAGPNFQGPDQFWFFDFEDDDGDGIGKYNTKIEAGLVDNQERGVSVFLYPLNFNGEIYDKIFEIPNAEAVEARAGDIDGDGGNEFVVFYNTKEGNGGVATFNREGNEVIPKLYEIEKKITDGQVVGEEGEPGEIVVTVNEFIDEENPGIYELENGVWKPFDHDYFDAKEFAKMVKNDEIETFGDVKMPTNPFKRILYEDLDEDGENEILLTNEWDRYIASLVFSTDGSYNIELGYQSDEVPIDFQFGNINPHRTETQDIVIVSYKHISAFDGAFKSDYSKYGLWGVHSYLNKTDEEFKDVQRHPHRKILSKEAREDEGSMDWVQHWVEELDLPRTYRNFIISTKEGLWASNNRDFLNIDSYDILFDYEQAERLAKKAEVVMLKS